MSREDLDARRGLTFGQAEGVEPLPQQLERGEIPTRTRAKLWEVFDELINKSIAFNRTTSRSYLQDPVKTILLRYYIDFESSFSDTFPSRPDEVKKHFRPIFTIGKYHRVFNFIQHFLQYTSGPNKLSEQIDRILKDELSAYRVYDYDLIAPVGSDIDASVVQQALEKTRSHGAHGARSHIRSAIEALNNNDFGNSVEQSISAIESLARIIANDPKAELSKALSKIDESANIHGAMKVAFTKLYGYTSDEEGLRHSLLFKEKADVDEADALFMIGACSSFVTYLITRANEAGISITQASVT